MKKFIFNQYIDALILANLTFFIYQIVYDTLILKTSYVVFSIVAFFVILLIVVLEEKFNYNDRKILKNLLYFASYTVFILALSFLT